MENTLQHFHNEEFGRLEVVMIHGKPYFPATQCARLLGYVKPHNAVSQHCRNVLKCGVTDGLGREQETNFITEGDLYRLIVRSRLPAATRFERWVFDEVLPKIRQTGVYVEDELLNGLAENPDAACELFCQLQEELDRNSGLAEDIDTMLKDMSYCSSILDTKNSFPISMIAKDYGVTATKFNRLLQELNIQDKIDGTWLLASPFHNKGYTHIHLFRSWNGEESWHTYWTQKGRMFLYEVLREYGMEPVPEQKKSLR